MPASIVFWENVPGVLSTADNAFGCFLAGLAGEDDPLQPPGGKWQNAGAVFGPKRAVAWRVLDAQYFGVAQRRRRVFVVASARNGFDPAAVLFEFDGVRRDTAPRREAGKVAPTIPSRSSAGGGLGTDFDLDGGLIAQCVTAGEGKRQDYETCTMVAQPISFGAQMSVPQVDFNLNQTLQAKNPMAVAHSVRLANTSSNGWGIQEEVTHTLDCTAGPAIQSAMQVRRLLPEECESLMGFPRGYTAIPWRKKPASECPDGPRYKALGNSWAVPVVAWIGRRIQSAL